jgi:hypothetical protein
MWKKNEIKFWRWRLWKQELQAMLWWCLWWGLAESAFGGSLESGGRFCVGAFGRNLASVAVKMFSHSIYFIKKFYKFCTFSAICKDNAAINCITVQHKKRFSPVKFDGSYYASNNIIHVKLSLYLRNTSWRRMGKWVYSSTQSSS